MSLRSRDLAQQGRARPPVGPPLRTIADAPAMPTERARDIGFSFIAVYVFR